VGIIETQYDLEKDLTVVKATGKMIADDFHNWTDQYYRGTVTKLVLWDIVQADLSELKTDDIRDDAKRTKGLADGRSGGRTAIVTGNAFEYGMSRMLEAFYDLESVPFEVQAFHTIDEAMQWLGVKD
jgi:hypothetical protein